MSSSKHNIDFSDLIQSRQLQEEPAVKRILGAEAYALILKFDKLRQRRNQFEYQGLFEMGSQELDEALHQAGELVEVIRRRIVKA